MAQLFARKPQTNGAARHFNGRVVLGVCLIVSAAVGSWAVYRFNATTTRVFVASRLLVEGQQITASDIRSEEVGVSALSAEYASDAGLIVGKVVTRVVHPGELIPQASVGEASETLQTTLVIELSSSVASSLREGSIVDVWAADSPHSSSAATVTPGPPHAVVRRARLAVKRESGGSMTAGEKVEVVLPRSAVPDVLQAVAQGSAMTVVASSGGLTS
jgi:hypothetical protein